MSPNPSNTTVLVTGAGGFIAMHCILQLLEQGYRVRGTLRNLTRETQLRKDLAKHVDADKRLEFVYADLLKDDGWEPALRGCDYVLHVASPLPAEEPKDENDLIIPARDGTLRVLRAAAAGKVKRVVFTSSLAAIFEGYGPGRRNFDENDWSDLNGKMGAYSKSKTLAERAAWDFINGAENTRRLELAVINPGFVLGPYLGKELTTSGQFVSKLMRREIPGLPRMSLLIVDVRDVAAAHIAAMTTPEAAGQRFCCVGQVCWVLDIAQTLERHFGPRGYRIPTLKVPNFVVHLVAIFDKTVGLTLELLDKEYTVSTTRIEKTLGWHPRPLEETIVSMAESMIQQGIV